MRVVVGEPCRLTLSQLIGTLETKLKEGKLGASLLVWPYGAIDNVVSYMQKWPKGKNYLDQIVI